MKGSFIRTIAVCALIAASTQARADDAVTRGRYLAILGDCSGCHTVPHGAAYAGGLAFTASFGTLYSSNITPDAQTGIGNWTVGLQSSGDVVYVGLTPTPIADSYFHKLAALAGLSVCHS